VKTVRQFLRNEAFWTREEFYAYSYWKSGTSEDGSEVARRAEHQGKIIQFVIAVISCKFRVITYEYIYTYFMR